MKEIQLVPKSGCKHCFGTGFTGTLVGSDPPTKVPCKCLRKKEVEVYPTCPHCGAAWSYGRKDGTRQCGKCGKTFTPVSPETSPKEAVK